MTSTQLNTIQAFTGLCFLRRGMLFILTSDFGGVDVGGGYKSWAGACSRRFKHYAMASRGLPIWVSDVVWFVLGDPLDSIGGLVPGNRR
jgi:hypothetical protein